MLSGMDAPLQVPSALLLVPQVQEIALVKGALGKQPAGTIALLVLQLRVSSKALQ